MSMIMIITEGQELSETDMKPRGTDRTRERNFIRDSLANMTDFDTKSGV